MPQTIWVVGFRDLKPFDMVSEGEWVREIHFDGSRYSAVVAPLVLQAEHLAGGTWSIGGNDTDALDACLRQASWGEPRYITDGADLPEIVARGVEPPTRSCKGEPGRCDTCPGLP